MTDPFPEMLWTARLRKLRRALAERGLDGLVVSHAPNVRYLTGFAGSGFALVSQAQLLLVTDHRYEYMAQEATFSHTGGLTVSLASVDEALRGLIRGEGVAKPSIGLEAAHLSYMDVERLTGTHLDVDFEPTTRLVETLRLSKDKGEVARIELAAQIADESLAAVFSSLGPGCSEKEFAEMLRRTAVDQGADGLAFKTIVASGPNSGFPHSVPTERIIKRDEPVIVDFGCLVDGYRSDMTRTLWYGRLPSRVSSAYAACVDAHLAAVSAVSTQATHSSIAQASDAVLVGRGYAACPHPVGHHVGLEIHERPYLSVEEHGLLPSDSVITIEPGIYLRTDGGVRVEDTVVVSAEGVRMLTRHPVPQADCAQ